ncbi:MAG: hypothetical protein WC788_08985 [Candidatus Paceibacterota bacterium]|jgi:hypothetical protein
MINDPDKTKKYRFSLWKIGILAIVTAYFLNIALHYAQWTFLDNVDLIIHEAGHFIFGILGNEFLAVAGGTLLQILMPLAFVTYFFLTGQKFSGALTMFWLGQSFLNVSVYAQDAVRGKLPLLGGDGSIHDWNFMLRHLNLLPSTDPIAGAIHNFGVALLFMAMIGGLLFSRERKNDPGSI